MIQRPQTAYLFLAILLNVAVFFNSIYSKAMADPEVWIGFGLAISLTFSLILAFISVLLYSSRPKQLKIVKIGTYIQIVALGFGAGILFSLGGFGAFLWQEATGVAMIILSLAMYWLAGRGIKKDEELVESMDRIR